MSDKPKILKVQRAVGWKRSDGEFEIDNIDLIIDVKNNCKTIWPVTYNRNGVWYDFGIEGPNKRVIYREHDSSIAGSDEEVDTDVKNYIKRLEDAYVAHTKLIKEQMIDIHDMSSIISQQEKIIEDFQNE